MNNIKVIIDRNKNKIIAFFICMLGLSLIIYEIIHSGIIQNWWMNLNEEIQATIIIVALLSLVLIIVSVGMFIYISFLRHLGGVAGKKLSNAIDSKFKDTNRNQ